MRWLFPLLLLISTVVRAESTPVYITFPSDIDWVTRTSSHFQVLFRRGQDRTAERTLIAAEKAYQVLLPIFPEMPPQTWIVLADFQDTLNGYAIDFPFPHMAIFASPPDSTGGLAALDHWLESVVLHEMVHVLHLYPANGLWAVFRAIFGPWVLPNGLMPSHLHEGLATFLETELTHGGRGRGTTFSMYRRMAVKKGVWGNTFVPLDLLEGSSTRWPQGRSPYFFGYLLYEELWSRKRAEGIRELVWESSYSFPYLINTPVRKVYGQDYPSLWAALFEKNRLKASQEISAIEKQPLSSLNYITHSGFHKWDLRLSPDGKKAAFRSSHPDTGTTLNIVDIPSGKIDQHIELEPGHQEGLCWLQRKGHTILVFTETENEGGYVLNVLRTHSVEKGTKGAPRFHDQSIKRVQTLACASDGRSVYTYHHQPDRGVVRHWEPSEDLHKWELRREWELQPGEWVSSLVGDAVALIAVRKGLSTILYQWPEGQTPQKEWELSGHVYGFRPRLTTGEWPGISTLSGRDEVWAFDLKKHRARKLISVLGGVNSFDQYGDQWWVSSYEHGGYDLAKAGVVAAAPQTLEAPLKPTDPPPSTAILSKTESYGPWSTLFPRAWIPSMLIVPDGLQVSAWIPGFDISQRHIYNLFGGYDTRGSPFLLADYSYRFGKSQTLTIDANFLPTYLISSRDFLKQWGYSIAYSTLLATDWPRLSLSAQFKRVESSRLGSARQSIGLGAGLSHSFWTKTKPRLVAPVRATQLSVNYSHYFQTLGSTDEYFSVIGGVDQYLKMPWLPHVVKFSAKAGLTQGTPLYNSFFQGGGELVFSSGRNFFLNRGFLPGTFFGQKLVSFNLDYLFPIVEIERGWSQWPVFLRRLDGSIVVDTSSLSLKTFYWSAGVELRSSWRLFYYFPSSIRLGMYHGFGPYGEPFYFTMALEASLI